MAKMIPSFLTEEDREDESKEYLIYDSLRKSLSDDYIVYHSLESSSPIVHDDLTMVKGGLISKEKEADFVIFHPDKGIIIIEAIIIITHCDKFKNSKLNNVYIKGQHATNTPNSKVIMKHALNTLLSNKFFSNILLLVLQLTLCNSCIKTIVKNTIVLAVSGV